MAVAEMGSMPWWGFMKETLGGFHPGHVKVGDSCIDFVGMWSPTEKAGRSRASWGGPCRRTAGWGLLDDMRYLKST